MPHTGGIDEEHLSEPGAGDLLRLLTSAIAQSSESILITEACLDLPGPKVVYVNPAFSRMTGYSREDIIGQTPRILHGPDTDRAVLKRLRKTLSEGGVFEGETTNYRKDGVPFSMRWQITPIRNSNGAVTHLLAIQRDVTEQLKTEAAANQLSAIVEWSDDAIIGKSLDGTVKSWNKGAERIFGYSAAEMIGVSITRIIPDDRLSEEEHILSSIRSGRTVAHFETVRRNKAGRFIDISLTASPIKDSSGAVIGVSKSARDITAQKHARDTRNALEARYRILFEHAPDGILISDDQSYCIDANASMCKMLGYSHEQLVGLHAAEMVVEEEIPRIEPEIASIRLGGDYHREWRIRRKNGTVFTAEITATKIPDGTLSGSCVTFPNASVPPRK